MRKIDGNRFKIRCSAIGQIMSGEIGLTVNQLLTLIELQDKKTALTDKQETTLSNLITKRDNPELPQGVKKFCKDWLISQLYEKNKTFSSKYCTKGVNCESDSIDFINEKLNLFAEKNEIDFNNEFFTGTPDIVLNNMVIDIKNSWDCFTFPLFENEPPKIDYIYQLQGYMALTERKKAMLIYTLMDAPEFIIEQESWHRCRANGENELTAEIYENVKEEMSYSNIEDVALRMQVYEFDFDQKTVNEIIERVKLCRSYIDYLQK